MLSFDHSYARLPTHFYARVAPTPVNAPQLIRLNHTLAAELGLDVGALSGPDGVALLAGNRLPDDVQPIAMAYAGHQFGNFVPQLGDGRAVLLGELLDARGKRWDVQLKGAGRTPFSRGGDGRAALGPVLREYLGSEAMAALGIPTTRSLAALRTGEAVLRDTPQPGGILVRAAAGHVRVGTFQYFARQNRPEAVQQLADYVIWRHYPELADSERPYVGLLDEVVRRTADLVAQWLLVGFIHGVMNTDNVSVAGETIDYGPFGFLDHYDPRTVYSFIDRYGRYAYGQQPGIAQWNLDQFAQCLLPLLASDLETAKTRARESLERFVPRFEARYHQGLLAKIGLPDGHDDDLALGWDLLGRMAAQRADFTLTFRGLAELPRAHADADGPVRSLFEQPEAFDAWAAQWRQRLAQRGEDDAERRRAMRAVNPAVILRNHLAENAVNAASEHGDFRLFEELLDVLGRPFDDHPDKAHLSRAPAAADRVTTTFCGT